MKNSKIEWCTDTWNPMDGCLHNCRYCYARALAQRFGGHRSLEWYMAQEKDCETKTLHILEEPMHDEVTGEAEAYPFKFDPTYNRFRLHIPESYHSPGNVFVCSMGDLFGEWVEDWMIEEVFAYAKAVPRHNYLFLTKNPGRYNRVGERPDNMFWGATIDTQRRADEVAALQIKTLNFLSLEPILERIDLDGFLAKTPGQIEWVIIGAENGSHAGKVKLNPEWIIEVAQVCAKHGIPLFVKRKNPRDKALTPEEKLLGNHFRREYPEKLRANTKAKNKPPVVF